MKTNPAHSSCRPLAAFSVPLWLIAACALAADPPRPTPRPGTLGAYAARITLDRSALSDETGRVVLTNDNVVALGVGGSITLGAVATTGRKQARSQSVADNVERARWRAAGRQ